MMNGNAKTFSRRIIQAVRPVILGSMGILILLVFAWAIYELILAWRPYWEAIATFCFGNIAAWLIANHPQRSDEMTIVQRTKQARGLVAASLIIVAFVWRNYELAIAWRPYGGNIATFSAGFVAGLLIALHARWEKGWRMDPRLINVLRPIGYGLGYVGGFIGYAIGYLIIVGVVVWIYGGIVSYWKPVAWCIGGFALWFIVGWFATRKDRMRSSDSSEPHLPAQSQIALLQQRRTTADARAASPDEPCE
jgi:hypothetical protein